MEGKVLEERQTPPAQEARTPHEEQLQRCSPSWSNDGHFRPVLSAQSQVLQTKASSFGQLQPIKCTPTIN